MSFLSTSGPLYLLAAGSSRPLLPSFLACRVWPRRDADNHSHYPGQGHTSREGESRKAEEIHGAHTTRNRILTHTRTHIHTLPINQSMNLGIILIITLNV